MKKRKYLILVGLLAGSVLAAGCGEKQSASEVPAGQEVTISSVPTPTESVEGELVDMQKDTEEEQEDGNVIGSKSDSSRQITLVNQIGSEIVDLYVRPHTDQYILADNWGTELIQDSFTLKSSDKAVYYHEPKTTDDNGEAIKTYDIRVTFQDEEADEFFFRDLPLDSMATLKLCVDGIGGSAIPYVRYTTSANETREISTLEDVKKRLAAGNDSDESYDEDYEEDSDTDTPSADPTEAPAEPENPETPVTPTEPDDSGSDGNTDQGAQQAAQFIGQSLETMIGSIGAPSSSEYADEPETGKTGYHYYSTFTVSTSVDADGNEVVAGVW